MDKNEIVLRVQENAIQSYGNGLNCSECVTRSLIDTDGVDFPKDMLKLATGFGGGVGLYGCMCGALSAAVIGVGYTHGRDDILSDVGDREELLKSRKEGLGGERGVYKIFNNVIGDFKESVGHVLCEDIVDGCEFSSKERALKCRHAVGQAAAIAAKWILTKNEGGASFVKNIKNK